MTSLCECAQRARELQGLGYTVKLMAPQFNATEENTTMTNDSKTLGKVVQVDDHRIQG